MGHSGSSLNHVRPPYQEPPRAPSNINHTTPPLNPIHPAPFSEEENANPVMQSAPPHPPAPPADDISYCRYSRPLDRPQACRPPKSNYQWQQVGDGRSECPSPPFEGYSTDDDQHQDQEMVWVRMDLDNHELSILPCTPPQTPPRNCPCDQGQPQPQVYPLPPSDEPVVQQLPVLTQSQPQRPPIARIDPTPNVPEAGIPVVVTTNSWSSDLFDCFDNLELAVLTTFCPCVTFGRIAEIIDGGQTSCATSGFMYGAILILIRLPCLMSWSYRFKLRSRYNLIESPAADWIIHCFCECCALCQEYRELQHRGFDPSIGWTANLARDQMLQQQQPNGIMSTPPANQTMTSR